MYGGKHSGYVTGYLATTWQIQQRPDPQGVVALIGHDSSRSVLGQIGACRDGLAIEERGFAIFEWCPEIFSNWFHDPETSSEDRNMPRKASWYHAKGFVLTVGGIYLLKNKTWEGAVRNQLSASFVSMQSGGHPIQKLGNRYWEWIDGKSGRYRPLRGGLYSDVAPVSRGHHNVSQLLEHLTTIYPRFGFRVGASQDKA